MKIYEIYGFGNFSHDFCWDNGLSFCTPVETDVREFVPNDPQFMGRYVNEVSCNEHGGSRSVYVHVEAYDEYEALTYAKIWASHYYPEFDKGD